MDFPGSDLKPVFETTFNACTRICLNDPACAALTFNTKKNACFPKSGIGEKLPFDGAFSATVYKTRPHVLGAQKKRLAALSFLPANYFSEARVQGETLAGNYLSNEWTPEQLLDASRNAASSGNMLNAMRFMGAALNLTDAAGDWVEMARLALLVKPKDNQQRRKLEKTATSAAINA
ncbi:MAG: PAN/Apple domain-containing protein, partial [Paracoccaceae bacterium]